MSVRATHVLWVIWDVKTIVTLISKFDPRKGQFQVILGKIRSNFKTKKFLTKTCLSFPVLSQDSKNVIYFYVRQLEMPKIAFQGSDVITYLFFYDCTAKYKGITFKFGIRVVCI